MRFDVLAAGRIVELHDRQRMLGGPGGALVVDLMTDYFDLIRDWAQRSRATVEQWPDLDCDDARQHQARERIRRERDER